MDEEKKIVVVRVVKNPYRALRGKYRDPGLVYEIVEESVDELLFGEEAKDFLSEKLNNKA